MPNLLGRAVARGGLWHELSDKVRVVYTLARRTGLWREMTPPGIVEAVRALVSGSQNPALLYRIHGENTPDKPALIWRDRTLSWAELDGRIDRLCSGLRRRGVGRRASVLTMLHNRPEVIEVASAAARAGAAAVGISYRTTARELTYLANHSGAVGIVIEPALLPVLEEASPTLSPALLANVFVVGEEVATSNLKTTAYETLLEGPRERHLAGVVDEDAAFVVYTSGTTGKPKGAVRKFPKDTIVAAMRFINETPMRSSDVHLVACPLYHSTAFGFLGLAHILGNTVVLMEDWKPEPFLSAIDRYGVTTTAVVPTMLYRVLHDVPEATRARYDTRSLRVVFTGGAPLSGPLALRFMDTFGDVLYEFYGATETGLVTLAKPADLRAAPGTMGRVVPGSEIRLLDDARRDVPDGSVGELFVRNKLLVAGYHLDDASTRASIEEGFFSVGDLARRDESGRYYIEGRKSDMIISGGVNVYPAEIEAVLEQHPDVGEVAVVGVPDPEWGERVRAFVVPRPGAALDEGALKAFARERLAGPKVPRDFVVLDALPRNPTGKVLKRDLRSW